MSLSLSKIRSLQTTAQFNDALELIDSEEGRKLTPAPERNLVRAVLASFLGQADEGELEQATNVEPDTNAWRSDRGLAFMLLGRMDEAKKEFYNVIETGDADAVTYGRLATLCTSLGEVEEGERLYQEAIAREPERPEWLSNMGGAKVRLGKYEEALELYERALVLKTEFLQAQQGRERVLLALSRAEDLISSVKSEIEQDPGNAALQVKLARVQDHAGELDEAITSLKKAQELDPENANIYIDAGHIFQRNGMAPRALQAFKKAMESDPDNLQALSLVAASQSEVGNGKEGLKTIDRAIATHPKAKQLKVVRGRILADLDRYEEAEEDLRNALEAYPGDAAIMIALGGVLSWIGKIDEAIELYRQAAKVNPAALSHALQHNWQPDDPAEIELLEKIASNKLVVEEQRATLNFALADYYERQKNYPRAFKCVDEANKISWKNTRFDNERNTNQTDRLKEVFTKEFFALREGWGHPSNRPIFVCGMPRSGTTLTEQILCTHDDVFGGGELPYIAGMFRKLTRNQKQDQNLGPLQVLKAMKEGQVWNLGSNYLSQLSELDDEHRFVVDKMPHNFQRIGMIKMMLPNAKIIHLKRDPRDVAVSNYFQNFKARHGGLGYAFDLESLGKHLNDHERMMQHWHEVLPGQIFELDYEKLTTDFETTVRELLEFVGLDWSDKLEEFYKTERAVKTASVSQVRQPLYQHSVEKWRRYAEWLGPLNEVLDAGAVGPAPSES
ncbi:tetratricopeptide repeat-containing sulfotransferase family protein [Rhodovibrionaceae bacterium A322]